MSKEVEIVNKVANSPLITIDLEDYYDLSEKVELDMKPWLFHEMILKEKDFRNYVKEHNWLQYKDKYVAVFCSADAIIPNWAYMIVASKLSLVAKGFINGTVNDLDKEIFRSNLSSLIISDFQDKKVVVKGCGDIEIPSYVYMEITKMLAPVVSSIMYGEPCSTVPVYKKKKN